MIKTETMSTIEDGPVVIARKGIFKDEIKNLEHNLMEMNTNNELVSATLITSRQQLLSP